jgi:hypothetical protein
VKTESSTKKYTAVVQLDDYAMKVAMLHTDGNPKDEPEVLIP